MYVHTYAYVSYAFVYKLYINAYIHTYIHIKATTSQNKTTTKKKPK